MSSETHPDPGNSKSVSPAAALLQDKQVQTWSLIGGLIVVLVYSYWNTLSNNVFPAWETPEYSHGYLIPVFAAVLMWLQREPFSEVPLSDRWWGAGLVLAGMSMRLIGTFYVTLSVDNLSIIPCLMGIFILVGGLRTLRWAGPAIAFLIFMFPLPQFAMDRILRPLQSLATGCSIFALQTLGVEGYRDGNRIILDNIQMGVVDQCSGLRMLTIFFALAVAIAMISTTRPWWERLIIIVSAGPIALTVNVIRITITGLLYSMHVKQELAQKFFHDGAGWVMMPMALGFLYLEYQILSRLVIETSPAESLPTLVAPAVGALGRNKRKKR